MKSGRDSWLLPQNYLGEMDISDKKNVILNKVDKWGNDITIYPGHADGCTMKKVRQINKEFLDIVEGK